MSKARRSSQPTKGLENEPRYTLDAGSQCALAALKCRRTWIHTDSSPPIRTVIHAKRYEIKCSIEDGCYVVLAPEWEERYMIPIASGKTYAEAARRGRNTLENMIEFARERGETLPEPRTFAPASAQSRAYEDAGAALPAPSVPHSPRYSSPTTAGASATRCPTCT
jgi:predicted RNase H-like HicB family nuclease